MYKLLIIIIIFLFLLLILFFNYNNKETFVSNTKTVILLGDSILNNQNYVPFEYSIPYILKSYLYKENNNLINALLIIKIL